MQKYFYLLYWLSDNKKDLKIYGVNPWYLIFNKVNEYFEDINGNKN